MTSRNVRPGELADRGQLEGSDLPPHLSRLRGMWKVSGDGHTLPGTMGPDGLPPTASSSGGGGGQTDILDKGQLIEGRYEIRKLLGSGGMGQVWEARDRGLNRLVAIKIAWPHIGADALRREAQVLAAFRHPGLVCAHALGQHEGREFLVMERLSGQPLAGELARRRQRGEYFTFDEAASLLLDMASTLSVIHASGLAHCDLKPANVMLVPGGRVVLLDFGIVRIEQLRGNDRLVSGSPHYMAPETIRSGVRPGETHLVDVYALGVIGYVLLAGQPPFDHADPVELLMLHLEAPPPPVESLRPDVPRVLSALVHRMLEKRPDDRPDNVEEVATELRAYLGLTRPRRFV